MERIIDTEVERNMEFLRTNSYPGRGFIMGRSPDGDSIVQVYWLMGRSDNSRNRQLVQEGHLVKTAPIDPKKVKDPSLIIYNAMREEDDRYVVSNGKQTDTIFNAEKHLGSGFREAMFEWQYEPDEPNYTPRITAMYDRFAGGRRPAFQIAILSRSLLGECVRTYYEYEVMRRGYGYCVHAYDGDGDPLPSFSQHPYLMRIKSRMPARIALQIWQALDPDNRIAIAAKVINQETGKSLTHIINQY